MIPGWYALGLLALAVYRSFRLISEDEVLDRPRGYILNLPVDWHEGQRVPNGYHNRLADFLICPWCLGFWLSFCWWGAWIIWPHAILLIAAPFAISTLVGSLAHVLHHD